MLLLGLAGLILLFWRFPLFHIVPLTQARERKQQAAFNAAEFAHAFWNDQLMPSLDRAADAVEVVSAIARDPQAARQRYGRTVGLSRTYYLFISGRGRLVSLDSKGLGISLHRADDEPEILLLTGLPFGNATRDATGLLDVSSFPNSQHFNDLSVELNRIVETQVLPPIKQEAAVGQSIEFVGCVEVANETRDLKPLRMIPIQAKLQLAPAERDPR